MKFRLHWGKWLSAAQNDGHASREWWSACGRMIITLRVNDSSPDGRNEGENPPSGGFSRIYYITFLMLFCKSISRSADYPPNPPASGRALWLMNVRIFGPRPMKIEIYCKIENEIQRNIKEYPREHIVKQPIYYGYDRNKDQFCPKIFGFH